MYKGTELFAWDQFNIGIIGDALNENSPANKVGLFC